MMYIIRDDVYDKKYIIRDIIRDVVYNKGWYNKG